MKQTIEIEVPEGFEAKYNLEENKIELIKKDKPETWEEYAESIPDVRMWYIDGTYPEILNIQTSLIRDSDQKKNLCTSEEDAEAFLALMQLRQLRKAWVKDWEPKWDGSNIIYCIYNYGNELVCQAVFKNVFSMNFPTKEMALKFIECFKDLLEKTKILL